MVSVIIPTYNEKENVERLVTEVADALSGIDEPSEILIVDDNSPDGTGDEVLRLAERFPVRLVLRKSERGLATAVLRGFKEAKGDLLAVMDADLSHPPMSLRDLQAAIRKGGADMAIGSRFVKGGGTEDWSRQREVISWTARMFSRGLSAVKDSTSGFFMFRKEVIEGVALTPVGYKIGLEILVKGRAEKVIEVPIIFRDRTKGKSKLGARVTWDYLRHLAHLYRWIILSSSADKDVGVVITFARFSTVGILGVIVNYGLFNIFHRLGGIGPLVSAALAIEISIITNFLLNNAWTWKHRVRHAVGTLMTRFVQYHLVAGVSAFGGNWLVFYILHSLMGFHLDSAYLIGIACGMLVNFFLNDRWTFARNLWEKRAV